MKKIFKYVLEATTIQDIVLPSGSEVLSVAPQGDQIVLYALVNYLEENTSKHTIYSFGTGHRVDEAKTFEGRTPVSMSRENFLGTVPMEGGKLMFHFFAERT